MNEPDSIARVMRTEFLRLKPDTPIRRAVADLVSSGETAAPVVDEAGHLIGIFTEKDCFAPALQSAYYQTWTDTVTRYMTHEVVTLNAESGLITAAEAFHETSFRAYPVQRDGNLVGMLTRSDLLAALLAFG